MHLWVVSYTSPLLRCRLQWSHARLFIRALPFREVCACSSAILSLLSSPSNFSVTKNKFCFNFVSYSPWNSCLWNKAMDPKDLGKTSTDIFFFLTRARPTVLDLPSHFQGWWQGREQKADSLLRAAVFLLPTFLWVTGIFTSINANIWLIRYNVDLLTLSFSLLF